MCTTARPLWRTDAECGGRTGEIGQWVRCPVGSHIGGEGPPGKRFHLLHPAPGQAGVRDPDAENTADEGARGVDVSPTATAPPRSRSEITQVAGCSPRREEGNGAGALARRPLSNRSTAALSSVMVRVQGTGGYRNVNR
ncbi:hypothetical protein Nans01_06160 [Nocardiopsis ansamitocini]|uniref:Uncharacterized protein n=1 Tax=Nocardiopsis ansamitocini TaxID=1670832 RepID=A0A9W6UHR2_9ACTN|nr:hypothetical protein Nans01_06160 [Nocardiopsis ansamitocini]